MDVLATYGLQGIDFLFIAIFFYVILKNLPLGRLSGAIKGAILVVIIWFVTRIFHFQLSETILGNIIEYGFLALMIIFPLEFRKLLENLGRRKLFRWNTKGLIDMDSRKELADAVINLARRKQGALFVIARQDTLDDLSENGVYVGESEIHREFLELAYSDKSEIKQGALIIKDDAIVSTNVMLPILETTEERLASLKYRGLGGSRHLAGLGVVEAYDCVAIIVSESTGKITLAGRNPENNNLSLRAGKDLKEFVGTDGIDSAYIINELEYYLKGSKNNQNGKKKPVKKVAPKQKALKQPKGRK